MDFHAWENKYVWNVSMRQFHMRKVLLSDAICINNLYVSTISCSRYPNFLGSVLLLVVLKSYCQAEVPIRSLISVGQRHYSRKRRDSSPHTSVISKLGTGNEGRRQQSLQSKQEDVSSRDWVIHPSLKKAAETNQMSCSLETSVSPLTIERTWTTRTDTVLNSKWP